MTGDRSGSDDDHDGMLRMLKGESIESMAL